MDYSKATQMLKFQQEAMKVKKDLIQKLSQKLMDLL